MKKRLTFLLILINLYVFAQNIVEINNDKESQIFYQSLKQKIDGSKTNVLKIYVGSACFIFGIESNFVKTFTNTINKQSLTYSQSIENNFKFDLNDAKSAPQKFMIDIIPLGIEMVENGIYFVKYIGDNESIRENLNLIFVNQIQDNLKKFIKELPSGIYIDGLTTFTINQPINSEKNKSTFYKKIENELSKNGISITDSENQPLIKINSSDAFFEDVNLLSEQNIQSYKIFNKKESIIYGTNGKNGVLLIELKP